MRRISRFRAATAVGIPWRFYGKAGILGVSLRDRPIMNTQRDRGRPRNVRLCVFRFRPTQRKDWPT